MKNLFKVYPTQSHLIPLNPTIISSLLYIYIIRYQIRDIIKDLYRLHSFINQLDKYDKALKLIFEEETEWFATHFNFFKPQALNMIIEITKFLEKAENEYDGITVLGI